MKGDQRQSANRLGWESQLRLEAILSDYLESQKKYEFVRAHQYDEKLEHGFIYSQKMGIEVFKNIPKNAKVIVAISIWCYSHHVLAGLRDHEGDILLVANWSGEWPGLVGMLNLAGSLTKMGKKYSRIWTRDGKDEYFQNNMKKWLDNGYIKPKTKHIKPIKSISDVCEKNDEFCELGIEEAKKLKNDKAIMCIFDEGCMGMYNAIFDDEVLNPIGVYKERLSQSYLVSQMNLVEEKEANEALKFITDKGLKINYGEDWKTELTEDQIIKQMKMYIAGLQIADQFGCDLIGVQYQQGLVHSTAASDLPEGMWNNVERPPVKNKEGKIINEGEPLVHFNEVDEGAGLDSLINNRIAKAFNIDPATTLHDIRFGEEFNDEFVWILEISGAVPPSHFQNGWKSATSERQSPMYFPLGGGTLKGISKVGTILWSRIFLKEGKLYADVGTAKVVSLPEKEQQRRWEITSPPWPVMNAVLDNVSKNQIMENFNANHINVIYVDEKNKDSVLKAKIAMMKELGINVRIWGRNDLFL